MDGLDFNPVDVPTRPKTPVVIALIAIAAGVFSYLWAYCLHDALVGAGFFLAPTPGNDPRPGRFVTSWIALVSAFAVLGFAVSRASAKHLSAIDEMEREE